LQHKARWDEEKAREEAFQRAEAVRRKHAMLVNLLVFSLLIVAGLVIWNVIPLDIRAAAQRALMAFLRAIAVKAGIWQ